MAVSSKNYAKIYKQGIADGFSVIDARHYYVKEADSYMRPDLEQMLATPWVCDNVPVFGYTVTNVDAKRERECGYRETNLHEFWIYDTQKGCPRNLDDVHPEGYTLQDATGKPVDMDSARNRMGDFAAAASNYPHVFMASEYAESRNYLNARMGLPEVTAKDYAIYLDSMERQLQDRITFTGKITKMSDIHLAWESLLEMPGGAAILDERQRNFAPAARDITQSVSPYDE